MLKYYLILDLSYPTTDEEVRKAYLDMVKRFPPERYPKEFARVAEAYEALQDETQRIHTAIEGFLQVNYPEEEILELGRLRSLRGARIGLSALMEAERKL